MFYEVNEKVHKKGRLIREASTMLQVLSSVHFEHEST